MIFRKGEIINNMDIIFGIMSLRSLVPVPISIRL
ncbi:unnamed protein product, partial [marine sediment metagenome]